MDTVKISGTEWPGTEWDVPGVWYDGSIVKKSPKYVYVKFEDCDEPLRFTRESIENYRQLYHEKLFETLIYAADIIEDARDLF